MEKSFINALKLNFEGSYIIDFETNSCEVLFSSFIPKKYEGGIISIERFMASCINILDENYKPNIFEFINKSNLRNAFINDKPYDAVYSCRVSEDSYALYKSTMFPQTAGRGFICTEFVNEAESISRIGNFDMENVHAIFLRIANDFAASISYANDILYTTLGYTRKEVKEQFNGSLSRISVDDFVNRISPTKSCRENNYYDFKVRLRHRSGETIWMHCIASYDKAADMYNLIMLNITEQVKKKQEAKVQDEIYKVVLENLDIMYFVYDVTKDLMVISISTGKGEEKKIVYEDYLQNIENIETIHPRYRRQLGIAFTRIIRGGSSQESFDYKNCIRSDKYAWARVHMSEVKDEEGQLYRIIGRIDNIEKEMHHRKEESRWREMAEQDKLTKLLSRDAGIEHIKRLVEEREGLGGALFLLDIDDFKVINDTQGHLEGDRILAEVAEAFSGQFRTEDVVCRYGGDEMLAFALDLSNTAIIKSKAANILKAIRCITIGEDSNPTCSIGIGIKLSGDTISYEQLFRNADRALYSAKSRAKNCSCIFEP